MYDINLEAEAAGSIFINRIDRETPFPFPGLKTFSFSDDVMLQHDSSMNFNVFHMIGHRVTVKNRMLRWSEA